MRGLSVLRVAGLLALTARAGAEGPVIDHSAVACMVAEKFPQLEASIVEPDVISRARVQFRGEGGPWYFVNMTRSGGVFTGVLPKPKKSLKTIHYYIEATDRQFHVSRTEEFAASVVPEATCGAGRMMAGVASTASVLVGSPAGAAAVPVGFSSSGVATTATAAAATGGTAGGGGIGTAAVVGIVAGGAAIAGVAVAAGGGSNDATPTTTLAAVGNAPTTTTTTLAPAPPPTTLTPCPACYAGNWRGVATTTAVGNPQRCSSSNVVGRVLTLFFVVAGDGTAVFPPDATTGFTGRIDSGGNFTIVLPGDTAPGLTCPEGGGTALCTTPAACAGTLSQAGNQFNILFDRLSE
jgi:hypothetical protein